MDTPAMPEAPEAGKRIRGKRHIVAQERRRQVLELRKAGADFRAIAVQVGYANPGAAYKAFKTAMREMIKEPAEEIIELQKQRLDALFLTQWRQVIALQPDAKPDPGALDRCLKIMAQQAELLGLNAPKDQNLNLAGDLIVRRYIGVDPDDV